MANVVCAWCKKIIGSIKGTEDSHGMCESCFEKNMKQLEKT